MHHLDHLRARRDGVLERLHDLLVRWRWSGEFYLPEDDPVPPLALQPRVDHARVVLRGRDDLVARLEIDAEDHVLVRLARVPRDRHLLRVAAELAGQVHPHALHPRLEHAPHVLHGELVAEAQIADHLLDHVRGRRRAAAVVEVDHSAVHVEGTLDLAPVVLIGREAGRRSAARDLRGFAESAHGARVEHRKDDCCVQSGDEEFAAVWHRVAPEGRDSGAAARFAKVATRGRDTRGGGASAGRTVTGLERMHPATRRRASLPV